MGTLHWGWGGCLPNLDHILIYMFDQGELHPFFTLAGACKEVVGVPQLLNMHIARPKWQTVES